MVAAVVEAMLADTHRMNAVAGSEQVGRLAAEGTLFEVRLHDCNWRLETCPPGPLGNDQRQSQALHAPHFLGSQ